jgi:2-(1,2-epoxy-1,2-dihydrophenyl)acetyl-CoA isomerase
MTMTAVSLSEKRAHAERLYEALAAGDAETIRTLLSEDFQGHVTPGMPMGAGGDHAGADAMMKRVWWAIGTNFRVRPVADEYHELDDGRLFVRGHYRGRGRATDAPLDAEFIHLLTFDGSRVTRLDQLTDSAEWRTALGETSDTIVRTS